VLRKDKASEAAAPWQDKGICAAQSRHGRAGRGDQVR
jgi:hypothetical protein